MHKSSGRYMLKSTRKGQRKSDLFTICSQLFALSEGIGAKIRPTSHRICQKETRGECIATLVESMDFGRVGSRRADG